MEKNKTEKDSLCRIGCKKKLNATKGITLIALVITIIVLLILAGVSLSGIFNDKGIFSRAEKAGNKYNEAKARETLELALGEAQMKKYEEGLTEEELDNQIGKIQGELLPKEKLENLNLQNVIVDGYIFEIDRSVPKIVDYIGPADGVVITASISGNNGWQKPDNAKVTITGTIKTYSGGTITSSSAIATNGVQISGFPTTGGNYTIEVTQDTTITITAKDSNNKENSKTITVTIRVDDIAPKLEEITVVSYGLDLEIEAKGKDNESGIDYFTYSIEPIEGVNLATGTFKPNEKAIITTTLEKEYTILVKAVDKCGNESEIKTTTENTINWIITTADDPRWYDYGTEVNKPVLKDNMKPIIYKTEDRKY